MTAVATVQLHLGVLEELGFEFVEFLREVDVAVATGAACYELVAQPEADPATVTFDAPLGAVEARAHAGAVHHRDVAIVNELCALQRLGVFSRDGGHRTTVIHAQAPVQNIDHVCAPVADHAAAVLLVAAPVREMAVIAARAEDGAVAAHRARADPAVPVEARLLLLGGQIAGDAGVADVDGHALDLADHAVAHEFAGHAEFA